MTTMKTRILFGKYCAAFACCAGMAHILYNPDMTILYKNNKRAFGFATVYTLSCTAIGGFAVGFMPEIFVPAYFLCKLSQ